MKIFIEMVLVIALSVYNVVSCIERTFTKATKRAFWKIERDITKKTKRVSKKEKRCIEN